MTLWIGKLDDVPANVRPHGATVILPVPPVADPPPVLATWPEPVPVAPIYYQGDANNPAYASAAIAGEYPSISTSPLVLAPLPSKLANGAAVDPVHSLIVVSDGKTYIRSHHDTGVGAGGEWMLSRTGAAAVIAGPFDTIRTTELVTVSGDPYNGQGYADKWYRQVGEPPIGGGGAPQFSLHALNSNIGPNGPPKGVANGWQFVSQALNDPGPIVDQGTQPVGPYFTDILNSGRAHRFTYEVRPHSTLAALDGFARMWIDGVLVINVCKDAVGVTPVGGWKPWCNLFTLQSINVGLAGTQPHCVMFGGWQSTGANAPYDVDREIDSIVVWIEPRIL